MHRLSPARRPAALTSLAVLAAAAFGWLWTGRAASQTPAEPPQVLVVGDSLGVGMRPYLGDLLPGAVLTWDVRSGRTTPQGMQRLRRQLRHVRPDAVLISLGTNDGPSPRRFEDRIRRTLRAIPPRACVVWADVNRPPRKGRYAALNRVLRAQARRHKRMTVVSWNAAVRRHRVVLPDHLHPDPAGFAYRAQLFAAAAARGCAAL